MTNNSNTSLVLWSSSCPTDLITIYITPSISLCGIVFNAFSTIVFTRMLIKTAANPHPHSINPLYRILHAKSLLELIMFILNVFMPVYYCRTCPSSSSLFAQIWFIYLFNYAEDVALTSSLVFEVMASFQCYFNLTNPSGAHKPTRAPASNSSTKFYNLPVVWIMSAIFLLTMLYSSFILFRFRIVLIESSPPSSNINNNNLTNTTANFYYYVTERTDYYNSSFDKLVRFIQSLARDVILIIVLFFIQSILIVFIRRRVEAKQTFFNIGQQQKLQLNSGNGGGGVGLEKCRRKTTMMVILSGMIYVLGHLPLLVYYLPFDKADVQFWSCYYLVSLVPFYLSYLPNFVIYCFFNKIFSRHLREILGIVVT